MGDEEGGTEISNVDEEKNICRIQSMSDTLGYQFDNKNMPHFVI